MEDNLQWKTTFGGRQPSVEDNLRWRMTCYGRQPSLEDNLWWEMTFDGRQPLWETTFGGRQPLVEANLWRKTTFGGRWPLVKINPREKTDNYWWMTTQGCPYKLWHGGTQGGQWFDGGIGTWFATNSRKLYFIGITFNPIQGGSWADDSGGRGQKRLHYIFWPYLLNGSSDLYEIWNLCS